MLIIYAKISEISSKWNHANFSVDLIWSHNLSYAAIYSIGRRVKSLGIKLALRLDTGVIQKPRGQIFGDFLTPLPLRGHSF